MTDEGLDSVAANLASVFSAGTRIGTSPSEPRTTRLGLVTYNSRAQQNADLNKFQSLDDLYEGVFGSHFQKVVVIYASSYRGTGEQDPLPVANRLKTSGVRIITVAYDQGGDGTLLRQLSQVASPGFNFSSAENEGNIIGQVQGALLESNCFCPNDWIQYRQFYSDTNSYRYGVCFQPVTLTAVWKAAKKSCANRWNNSYLVNEFNLSKHNFILDIVNSTVGFHQPFSYHIGGNKVGGVWKWDRPTGWEQPELKKWYNWEDGYPIASSTLNAILNQQTGQAKWENIDMLKTAANYVCETASCDTDNYCSSDGRLDE
ncbi:Protein CBG15364 [Caenorhabditis briggsae]|uniref:Protein CBG15364 n=1 Tax=Caenorhabditis briggsae TaxID=6238 RepID=A8XM16_CAEBR|nr:Protein CBG15364 [Caenorhabditis briggsae]CAP33691.1 Protein CBG15364 [Caenorhabditis briggsae]